MKEHDLIELGFNKVEVNDLESQNGYDYYYYTFEVFDNLTLISVDSDDVENDEWYIYNLDWPDIFKIKDKEHVIHFLESVNPLLQFWISS
jgi:hypothetical protein